VIEPVDAKPTNDVGVFYERQQVSYLTNVKLEIRVCEEDQLMPRIGESVLKSRGITEIRVVMKHTDMHWVGAGEAIGDLTRLIGRTIIDNDDLPIAQLKRPQHLSHSLRSDLDIVLFVVSRKDG
jgi:hypothetical protein